jgi:hypothetical protein
MEVALADRADCNGRDGDLERKVAEIERTVGRLAFENGLLGRREVLRSDGRVECGDLAAVHSAQDRPSSPPQEQVMRVRGGEKDVATPGQDPCRR